MIYRKVRKFVFLVALTALLSACAPSLGNRIEVNVIPDHEVKALTGFNNGTLKLNIGGFYDRRVSPWIGEIKDGRKIEPEGNIGHEVELAFERHLRLSSVTLARFDAPTLSGEVTDWKVDLAIDFPASRASANAALKVNLSDKEGNLVYSGTYSGNAGAEHPLIEDHIDTVLGKAMHYAISAALSDQDMLNQLVKLQ